MTPEEEQQFAVDYYAAIDKRRSERIKLGRKSQRALDIVFLLLCLSMLLLLTLHWQ